MICGVLGLDARAARYTWTVVFVLSLAAIAYLIRETLFLFVLALLFAYLLWPLVDFLDQRLPGQTRVPALSIVYVALIGLLILVGIQVGTRVVQQANALATKVPELLAKLQQPTAVAVDSTFQGRIFSFLRDEIISHSRDLVALLPQAVLGILSHTGVLLYIVLVPILSFFFLKDGRAILADFLGILAGRARREIAEEILSDIHLLLARYMRALVLLALVAFVAYGSFLSILGAPYSILLAAITFPLELIPILGPVTAAIIILLVTGLSGFDHLLWILSFLGAFRIFQDYVLSPRLLSAGMELHPLMIVFGVIAGSQIAGIAGTFLSVPALAIIRIIYRQLQLSRHRTPGAAAV